MSRQSRQTKSEKAIFGRLAKIELRIQNLMSYVTGDLPGFSPLGERVESHIHGSGYLRAENLPKEMVWVASGQRKIPITELSDHHLMNIIRYTRDNVERHRIRLIRKELNEIHEYNSKSKLWTALVWEGASESNILMKSVPQWSNLLLEASRRQLIV